MSRTNKKMFIARNTEFGPPQVIKIEECAIPQVRKNEILVLSKASTLTVADCRLRSKNVPRGFGAIMGLLFGFRKPKYKALGTCVAGEVVEVGQHVKSFAVGDRVLGNLGMKLGGHAQYVSILENSSVVKIPIGISYEDAAAIVFGGVTALGFLRDKLRLKTGDRLLVIGAGGAVGCAAVQIGRILGAHVTGVCSTAKVALVKELGANDVIDYSRTEWRKKRGQEYNLILDIVGGTELVNSKHKLSSRGAIGLVIADLPTMLKSVFVSALSDQKVYAGPINETRSDLEQLMAWMLDGKLKAVIGSRFPFQKIVQAHQLVDQGSKVGNAVINFETQ